MRRRDGNRPIFAAGVTTITALAVLMFVGYRKAADHARYYTGGTPVSPGCIS